MSVRTFDRNTLGFVRRVLLYLSLISNNFLVIDKKRTRDVYCAGCTLWIYIHCITGPPFSRELSKFTAKIINTFSY